MLIRKNVLKLSIPIIIEQTFVMLLGVCNTMMAGHISEQAVSAIGMVDTMNNLFISFFAALSVGATVVVAQHIGKGNNDTANETAKQAVISGFILALCITILLWIFRTYVIDLLYGSAEELVKSNAELYLKFTLFTYPFIAIEQVSNGILRGCGNTKTPMYITMVMNAINIMLGYILIYGVDTLNIPSFGITGASLAIAIARIIGTAIIIIVLYKGSGIIKIRSIFPLSFNYKLQRDIFNIGIPAGMEQVIFNAGKLLVQIFIVMLGTTAIASNAVAMSIAQIVNVPGNALCLAATTLVGQYIGKDDVKGAKSVLMYLVKFATVCLGVIGGIFIIISHFAASLYTDVPEVIETASMLLRFHNIALFLFWPFAFILSAGLKGAGDTRYTMVTSFIGMWIFRIAGGYFLGIALNMGIIGIWIGMFVDWIIRGSMYFVRLRGTNWLKHRVS